MVKPTVNTRHSTHTSPLLYIISYSSMDQKEPYLGFFSGLFTVVTMCKRIGLINFV